jgi:RNA polymerase sigma factor (sigma-70 family)
MDAPLTFDEMLGRLRAGEPGAVREFVGLYEPFIRRTIRRRLSGTPLQAAADSVDVCQSALGSFLIRAAGGEFNLQSSDDLERLLLTIARRKLAALARRESADRRDRRRMRALDSVVSAATDSRDDPGRLLADADLLEQVEQALPPHESQLFQLRRQGLDWESIAGQLGESSVLLRKRLSRALRKVATDLGLDDEHA